MPFFPSAADKDTIALDVGFYLNGASHGSVLSEKQVRDCLLSIRPFTDTVRYYTCSGQVEKAYGITKKMGFQVVGSAWLSGYSDSDAEELEALIKICNSGLCDMAVVGSETLLRGDLSESKLISYINYVREQTGGRIPVTTADDIGFFLRSPALCDACDVLFVNYYPYWSKVSDSGAVDAFIGQMEALQKKYPNKTVACSETGTPTAGEAQGSATASPQQAARYFEGVREWSLKTGTQVFYFEAFDESWKVRDEGIAGGNWGILDSDLKVKDCYSKLEPFASAASLKVFNRTESYSGFGDVKDNAWYSSFVKSACEFGFMSGKVGGNFDPSGKITVAEAITVVSKMSAITRWEEIPVFASANWYDPYIAYAQESGILFGMSFDSYTRPVTRGEMARLLTAAIPDLYKEEIITGYLNIPDIKDNMDCAAAVYAIYRAGIVAGADAEGNYYPQKSLSRAEMAVFTTRIADPNQRIK